MMQVTQLAVDLIKGFEGLSLGAYRDMVGVWTIGYGTTAMAGVGITPAKGMTITKAEAERYLRRALDKFAASIGSNIRAIMNDNEAAALLSLAYNIGPGNFLSSSALRYFNAGQKDLCANSILKWNKVTQGGVLVFSQGLMNRREKEREVFLRAVA